MPKDIQGLIITAPWSADDIERYLPDVDPRLTLDFRAESRHDPLAIRFNTIALDDVFGEIERQRGQVEEQVQRARQFICESSKDLDSVIGRALRSIKVS